MSNEYTKEDWRYEVANDDTVLGYAEWVQHRKESHGLRATNDELAFTILRSLNRMMALAPEAVHSVLTEFGHSVNIDLKDDPHLPLQSDWSIQGMHVLNGLIHELTGRFVTPVYRDARPVCFKIVGKGRRK